MVRGDATRDVPAHEAIRGNTIPMAACDLVPADAGLITAKDGFVNDAVLTIGSFLGETQTPSEDIRVVSLCDAETAGHFDM